MCKWNVEDTIRVIIQVFLGRREGDQVSGGPSSLFTLFTTSVPSTSLTTRLLRVLPSRLLGPPLPPSPETGPPTGTSGRTRSLGVERVRGRGGGRTPPTASSSRARTFSVAPVSTRTSTTRVSGPSEETVLTTPRDLGTGISTLYPLSPRGVGHLGSAPGSRRDRTWTPVRKSRREDLSTRVGVGRDSVIGGSRGGDEERGNRGKRQGVKDGEQG